MNRKRVQMLRDMIAGIPENRIYLNRFTSLKCDPWDCGTIACIGGWAAMYPPFVADGLHLSAKDKYFPRYKGLKGYAALFEFFGLNPGCHGNPFMIAGHESGSHKQIALRRLDRLLAQ